MHSRLSANAAVELSSWILEIESCSPEEALVLNLDESEDQSRADVQLCKLLRMDEDDDEGDEDEEEEAQEEKEEGEEGSNDDDNDWAVVKLETVKFTTVAATHGTLDQGVEFGERPVNNGSHKIKPTESPEDLNLRTVSPRLIKPFSQVSM